MCEGAQERANELGYKTETFVLGEKQISVPRLNSILESRGIRGLLILPAGKFPNVEAVCWEQYAGVYADYIIEKPGLDSVCPDHFRLMMLAMSNLCDLGYKRPGFVIQADHDQRVLYRWESAFQRFVRNAEGMDEIEPHIVGELGEDEFKEWFEKYKPDVVLCHRIRVMEWIESMGLQVPRDCGFCALNVTLCPAGVSGLNLAPKVLGQRSVELLIGKLNRGELGVPSSPLTSMIPGEWVEGKTLRPQSKESIVAKPALEDLDLQQPYKQVSSLAMYAGR